MKIIITLCLFALSIIFLVPYKVDNIKNRQNYSISENTDKHSSIAFLKKVKRKLFHKEKNKIPDFSVISDVKVLKNKFFNYLVPYIRQENKRLTNLRLQIISLEKGQRPRWLLKLAEHYKLDVMDSDLKNKLLLRVDAVPMPIALAQSAIETNWGRSRFAIEHYNFFGLWCFQKGCGAVPKKRDEDKNHEVASFSSIAKSVQSYMHTLNTHPAYRYFRQSRLNNKDDKSYISLLSDKLINYSGIGEKYPELIKKIVTINNLDTYK